MNIKQKIESLTEKFTKLETWEDRYRHIIELGKSLPELSAEFKIEKYLVKGCQSQVWLVAQIDPDGKIHLKGDSDALIVRGLVAILLFVYADETPQEILTHPPQFLEKLGFKDNLSPSRSNGLYSMVRQIMLYATALQYMK